MKNELQKRFDALAQDYKNQQLMITRIDREHQRRLLSISRIPCGRKDAAGIGLKEVAACRDRLRAARNGLDSIEARMRILLADHFNAPVELAIEVLGSRTRTTTYFSCYRGEKHQPSTPV